MEFVMKTLLRSAAFIGAATMATASVAGMSTQPPMLAPPVLVGPSTEDDTAIFAGLNWVFGGTSTLEGVIGVIYRETDRGGDVTGARLSGHFDLLGRGGTPSVRVTGFAGDEDIAAEAGLGIGLGGSPYAVLGALGNYYNFGGLLGFDGTFSGYVGAHTYGDFDDRPRTVLVPGGPIKGGECESEYDCYPTNGMISTGYDE
jgi:hypothetical protein